MKRWIEVATILGMVMCGTGTAEGAYRYVFDSTAYSVTPGGTVAVNVYLEETDTTVLKDGVGPGLAGAGVTIVFNDPPLPGSPAEVLSTAAIANTSDFSILWNKNVIPEEYAQLLLSAGFDPDTGDPVNVYGVEIPADSGVYRALLGTFTFTAGDVSLETTYIRATDYDITTSDTITSDFVELDSLIADGTATITTLPEPTTFLLLLPGMFWVISGLRDRRCDVKKPSDSSVEIS
jgi:hypothetical protein